MAVEREHGMTHATGHERTQESLSLAAINPATGDVIGHVHVTPVGSVPELYERAQAAQGRWSALPVRERVRHLRRLRHVVAERVDEIAGRVGESTGKTEAEVLITEVLLVLSALQYVEKYGPRVLRRHRKPTPIFLIGKHSYVEYMPKGVVLVIGPWNFPLQLALVPVIYAVAAGNAVILKPSEVTPLVGVLIEELIEKAGLPEHLIQVVHGAGDLGAALVTPEPVGIATGVAEEAGAAAGAPVPSGPDHIFFTGSVSTGKIIQAEAAKRLIPTTLELSGKDAMIVFADAPMERAVNGAVWGGFMNCGQVCVGVERLYVERSIHDEFMRRMAVETGQLGQGSPGTDADLGSMTFAPQVGTAKQHVQDALALGATLVHGSPPDQWSGMFIPPVILANVTPDMRVAREETFGPIVTIIPFDSEAEVIATVNASPYGLNASVWSRDTQRAHRVASHIEAGGVAINDVIITLANQQLPFGGVKQSGLGRNHGEAGLKTFSHEKAVMRDWLGRKRDVHWFPYAGKGPLFAALLRNYFKRRLNWTGFLAAFLGLLRRSR